MLARTKLVAVALTALCIAAIPASAQRLNTRQRRQQKIENRQQRQIEKDAQKDQVEQAHAGDWLRRYKDLPPEEQRQALEKEPDFQKLAPQRQAQLLQRLQRFSSLPRQQQERILSRMETLEHLTPEQKRQRNQINQQIRDLPPGRRAAVIKAIRGMRDLTPEQRSQLLNSDSYKDRFSDHERELLSGAASLPLAPADGAPSGKAEE